MKSRFIYFCLIVLLNPLFFACSTLPVKKTGDSIQSTITATELTDVWEFQGYKIRYHMSGQGDPMIFLHNGGTDHRIWDYQIKKFSQTHMVYALDQLGFGESDAPLIPYTLDLNTEMLAAFIHDMKLDNVTLVGNCMGSAMSLNYALKNPVMVRRLILFNILTENTLRDGDFGTYLAMTSVPGVKSTLNFLSPYIWMPTFYINYKIKSLYGKNGFDREPDPEFLQHMQYLFKKPNQVRQVRGLASILTNMKSYSPLDTPPASYRLPPTCVLWGVDNNVLHVEAGRTLCNKYNLLKVYEIENAGHLLMREAYEEVNTIMEKFISETEHPE